MTNSDFIVFLEQLNNKTDWNERVSYLRDSEDFLDYIAQLSLTDKEKCKTYQEDIIATFEGMGKAKQVRTLLKTIIEAKLQQTKSDRLGRFSKVDAKKLIAKNGGFAWTYDNVRSILEQAHHIKFGWDVFTQQVFITEMSWPDNIAKPFEIPLCNDTLKLQRWGETYNQSKLKEALNQGPYPLESAFPNISDIVELIAKQTEQFDLAQRWLLSYEGNWDGVDRFNGDCCWPVALFKTKNPIWSSIWGRLFMLSIVTKIMEPGFPARNYFVIEGNQNVGKSKFCRSLVPAVWHAEKMLARETDLTELYRHISSKLIVEFPELGGKDKLTNNTWKMVTTIVKHSFRKMYKDDITESDNRCMFIITTNESRHLNDPTGETRPLAIEFGLAESEFPDWDTFNAMLPQLYAQAIDLYRKGERPYLKSDEERHLQKGQNKERELVSVEEEMINDFLAENKGDVERFGTRLDEIAAWCRMSNWSLTFGNGIGKEGKIYDALRKAGFKNMAKRIGDKVQNRWVLRK